MTVSVRSGSRFLWAFVGGVVTQAALFGVGYMFENASPVVLWNVFLASLLAGPMPIVGYGSNGAPIGEPTEVHYYWVFGGILLGVILYSVISYFFLGWLARRRGSR